MTRKRVFTPKSKKEQLQAQVLQMIRIIRAKLDQDVLDQAQKLAISMQDSKASPKKVEKRDTGHKEGKLVAYDRKNAAKAVSLFLENSMDDQQLYKKLLKKLKEEC